MASQEKLQQRISELIERDAGVDFEEIEQILTQLNAKARAARHGTLFKIPGCSTALLLNKHNNGKNHLPRYCVKQFGERMTEIGLYGQDKTL